MCLHSPNVVSSILALSKIYAFSDPYVSSSDIVRVTRHQMKNLGIFMLRLC